MISADDLGEIIVADQYQTLKVDQLVKQAKQVLKAKLVQGLISVNKVSIELGTTRTRFNGERLWFICPRCRRRVGTIYINPISRGLGCQKCLNIMYRKQRYHKMIEQSYI